MSYLGRVATGIALSVSVLFGLSTSASAYHLKTLYSFCSQRGCRDGAGPLSGLTMDAGGNLFGAAQGGSGVGGKIFELRFDVPTQNWKYQRIYSFCTVGNCGQVAGRLVVDTSGNLYGVTALGGAKGVGEFFELALNRLGTKRGFRSLYSFASSSFADAQLPFSALTYAGAASGLSYDGVSPLYGASLAGGANDVPSGAGAVYELTNAGGTWIDTVIYSFCSTGGNACTDGVNPHGQMILDEAGNLYGTTSGGGSGGSGVVYELSNAGSAWTQTVLYNACSEHKCADGSFPGGLFRDVAGNLVGMSGGGGAKKAGVVFSLAPSGAYSVLHAFCSVPRNCRDGAVPTGNLIADSSGNLFGVTQQGGGHDIDAQHEGGGVVFELSGSTLTTLYAFCAQSLCRDGQYPGGDLVMDARGNLFGTTQFGGKFGEGTVFELTP